MKPFNSLEPPSDDLREFSYFWPLDTIGRSHALECILSVYCTWIHHARHGTKNFPKGWGYVSQYLKTGFNRKYKISALMSATRL